MAQANFARTFGFLCFCTTAVAPKLFQVVLSTRELHVQGYQACVVCSISQLTDLAHCFTVHQQMLHLIFSMWAFSIYGVPRSGLSTPAFASLMRKICTGLAAMFEHACGITVDQATERLLGANSLHLLVLLIILVGVLFFNIIRSNLWLVSGARNCVLYFCILVCLNGASVVKHNSRTGN